MYRGPPGREFRLWLWPVRGTQVTLLWPQSPGSDLRDVSPFKKMLFPSCDPALAWESAQDRPRLSLPSRAWPPGRTGLPAPASRGLSGLGSAQPGAEWFHRGKAEKAEEEGVRDAPADLPPPQPCKPGGQVVQQWAQGKTQIAWDSLDLPVPVRNKSKINYLCLLFFPSKNGCIYLFPGPSIPRHEVVPVCYADNRPQRKPPGQGVGAASGQVENIHSKGRQLPLLPLLLLLRRRCHYCCCTESHGGGGGGSGLWLGWQEWCQPPGKGGRSGYGPPILGAPPSWTSICLCSRTLSLAHGSHHAGRVGVAKGEAGGGMDRCRRGQDVSRVAERWKVAHRGHVSGQGGRAEGR